MAFNEDTRVKLPAILHLCRLGYEYISLKNPDTVWDIETNIFTKIFQDSLMRINTNLEEDEAKRSLQDLELSLNNEDLGKAFFEQITSRTGIKIIDYDNFSNNSFHVVTELTYKNGDEEFRPDITLLINGLPLVFIEVKKPNNRDGILAERERINRRFKNNKFRKFVNITQLMIFSNNMEYDSQAMEPLQGAFYASTSYKKPIFNYFREEDELDLGSILRPEADELETEILKDNNLAVIKQSPEFITNKKPDSPTNRILTSLCSRERLDFILQYALTYVNESKGIEKHIMRYPQFFACRAIKKRLEAGVKQGIIWHTQGSGKTALAYYSVKYLTDYYQKQNIIPKFYFIVDRLDLLTQAKQEFSSRGLVVHLVNSREAFIKDIKISTAIHNDSGKAEITVINIQRFSEDSTVSTQADYDLNIQRVYFLDEVHRSYNPKGSFLANLIQSDPDAVKIGLTGTPLISTDYYTKHIFGDYIHKYYYNASIADGYTLRLIREEISSDYKLILSQIKENIEVEKGRLSRKEVFSHHSFVEPMLEYIIDDFERSRLILGNPSIGAMVVCDTSEQAKMMYEIFTEKYTVKAREEQAKKQSYERYTVKRKEQCFAKTSALILHDIGTKSERKAWVVDFKEGKIDILFVNNMLLTGFDAKRLKKLYLGRLLRKHNLLQALTRVNRTYQNFKFGYVVDFADIRSEFDATNTAYFKELNAELGDDLKHYSDLFKSKEEMEEEIKEIKEAIFEFDTTNAEVFSQQISEIEDRSQVLQVKKALDNAKGLANIIKLLGHFELLVQLDLDKINDLYKETVNHLALLNAKDAIENSSDNTSLINIALEDVIFHFTKISEEELILADTLKDTLRKTRYAFTDNLDKKDPEYISLLADLERVFKSKKLNEITQEEMNANIGTLNKIYDKIKELNRRNNLLKAKYDGDAKYLRIHKRMLEKGTFPQAEIKMFDALNQVRGLADSLASQNNKLLTNEPYFSQQMMKLIIDQLMNKSNFKLDAESSKYINNLVVKEYLNEVNGGSYYVSNIRS